MRPARWLLGVAVVCTGLSARADKIVLVADGGSGGGGSPAAEGRLDGPFGVDFLPSGGLVIVEMPGNRVRKADGRGHLVTIAGSGREGFAGDGGPAAQAELNGPHSLAVTPGGDILVADTWNNRVRRIDGKTGAITTVAGTGKKGFSGDGGPAERAEFGAIYSVALDPAGRRMVLADLDNRRIRAVDLRTGIVTTVAGNGTKGVPADGTAAIEAPLVDPRAAAEDADGNVYILERGGNALRVAARDGTLRTVAGTGKKGATGDGGDARAATFDGPKHLAIDRDGGVLIADTENHTIRKYTPRDGRIVRVAGTGKKGNAGLGGPPEAAELSQPHGVSVDRSGAIYIADSSNGRVLKIERD